MKCGNPNCKSKETMNLGYPHGLFGHVCRECNEELKEQKKEVAVKVAKVRRKYGKKANRRLTA